MKTRSTAMVFKRDALGRYTCGRWVMRKTGTTWTLYRTEPQSPIWIGEYGSMKEARAAAETDANEQAMKAV